MIYCSRCRAAQTIGARLLPGWWAHRHGGRYRHAVQPTWPQCTRVATHGLSRHEAHRRIDFCHLQRGRFTPIDRQRRSSRWVHRGHVVGPWQSHRRHQVCCPKRASPLGFQKWSLCCKGRYMARDFELKGTYPLRSKDQCHISPRIILRSVDDYFLIKLHSLSLIEMAVSLGVSVFTILK